MSQSTYVPLEYVTTTTIGTGQAAHYLNRQPQTLRHWAATGKGPMQPSRINGRQAWPVDAIRKLLGVSA